MKNSYSNIPLDKKTTSDTKILKAFDNFYSQPLEIDVPTYDAMTSFFTSKGFDKRSADTVSTVLIRQAKIDNMNPFQILDTLEGLDSLEISALVAEIINFNRLKTSLLGYAIKTTINEEIERNILF